MRPGQRASMTAGKRFPLSVRISCHGRVHGSAVVSYVAATCACERCGQWRHALSLLSEMRECNVETNDI
eukprot:7728712-Pyramimonas_sp.AAC.1